MERFLKSYWYVVAIGAIFAATFIVLGGPTVAGVIYIVGLTSCWVMERKIANIWRDAAYDIGGK